MSAVSYYSCTAILLLLLMFHFLYLQNEAFQSISYCPAEHNFVPVTQITDIYALLRNGDCTRPAVEHIENALATGL